ncbi:propionate kinase [candidate division WOR-3 bacterium JGI_Cruoil_03_44_89]|uniref:Acetate kinase n=1 Tax=candidate division WOR-3 bacterium JGI_Cruoil_03_44_89 TaxID=1973748 RepID=A0A235BQR8_UNCW3|nr:MAG: propionate kinase [candidate division WOR-3 bacterium JGI_Cruoil_03_44_89]
MRLILTLNCGSSSAKYQLYDWDRKIPLAKGIVERVTVGGSFINHEVPGRKPHIKEEECPSHREAIGLIMKTLKETNVLEDLSLICGVGHRVVHGGEKLTHSVPITEDVLNTFEGLKELAPLHNPPNILGIRAAMEIFPSCPHVAVIDTAFLSTMPPESYIYAIPYEWYEKYGVRRYGFHGTSHLYVSRRAGVLLDKAIKETNLITCHIGNGVSFTAIKNGEAYDHSMGLTPLEGLVMGTRSGDIDPAIVSYISERESLTAKEVVNLLNKRSGLFGITGRYTDLRDILKTVTTYPRSKLAVDIECHRMKKYIGAYIALLGRVDAIVFTAGAGELAWELRENCLRGMEELGIKLDIERNKRAVSRNHEFLISSDDSKIKVFVIPTDEELVMTEDTVAIIEGRYDIPSRFTYSFESKNYINRMREEAYQREVKCEK